uniref:Uncharacterized protein n=1 Tax=Anopheles farauti TaxID=69004 RepID=A0A182Q124_9DIPT
MSRAVFSSPSIACRSFFIDGRSSSAQSVVADRSSPSVNLLPFFTFRATSPTACVSARLRSLLALSVGVGPFAPFSSISSSSRALLVASGAGSSGGSPSVVGFASGCSPPAVAVMAASGCDVTTYASKLVGRCSIPGFGWRNRTAGLPHRPHRNFTFDTRHITLASMLSCVRSSGSGSSVGRWFAVRPGVVVVVAVVATASFAGTTSPFTSKCVSLKVGAGGAGFGGFDVDGCSVGSWLKLPWIVAIGSPTSSEPGGDTFAFPGGAPSMPDLDVRTCCCCCCCGHRSGAGPIGVEKSSSSGDFRSSAPSCCVIFRNGDIIEWDVPVAPPPGESFPVLPSSPAPPPVAVASSTIRCRSMNANASSTRFGSQMLSSARVFVIISLHSGSMPFGFFDFARYSSCDMISTISFRSCLIACTASFAAATLCSPSPLAPPVPPFDGESFTWCSSLISPPVFVLPEWRVNAPTVTTSRMPARFSVQVDRRELERFVALPAARLERAAPLVLLVQVLLRLRVVFQQLQVLVQQLHLPLAPLAAQLAHARDLLQQFLLARYPHRQQLLRDQVAQVTLEHHLQHADVAAQPGMEPVRVDLRFPLKKVHTYTWVGEHEPDLRWRWNEQLDAELRRQRLRPPMSELLMMVMTVRMVVLSLVFVTGEQGRRFERSGVQVAMVRKPAFSPQACVRSGIRNRDVSAITPSEISAHPIGTAVCVTFSRTSYAVKRISEPACKPSHTRNAIVQMNCGFELRSITSVRPYLIHPDARLFDVTCTTTDGLGGLPFPSHSKLSHEMTDSQMGISFRSANGAGEKQKK